MKTGKDFYNDIAKQEDESSRKWNQPDRETSCEDRKKNMWNRVTNKAKTDKEI